MADFKDNVPIKPDGEDTDLSNGYGAGTILFIQNLSSSNLSVDFGGDASAANRGVVLRPLEYVIRRLVTTVTGSGNGGFAHVSDTEPA